MMTEQIMADRASEYERELADKVQEQINVLATSSTDEKTRMPIVMNIMHLNARRIGLRKIAGL